MRTVLLSLAFFGLAASSQAAFIACTAVGTGAGQADTVVNATGTSATFNCNLGGNNINLDGLNILDIQLRVSSTFQENQAPPSSSYSVLFTSTNTLGLGIGNVGCTASGNESTLGGGQILAACSGLSAITPVPGNPDSVAAFQVTVTGQAGSNPLPFNASSSVSYQVNTVAPPTSGVPEPSTYGMMGTGLIGLYFARRRKKA